MARIIVNEGAGPEPCALGAARVLIGSSPDCDVQLTHPAARGCQFVIERTATGHRVITLLGELFLNEESCDVADLQHNDTLRAGESMVLYKNPDARLSAPAQIPARESAAAAPPAPGAVARHAAQAAEDPPDLEALGEMEELEDLPDLEELEELEEIAANEDEPAMAQATEVAERAEDEAVEEAIELLEELIEEEDEENMVELQAPSESPARAAPAGDVRFTRPLPPGHAAPAGPPPNHPGRPPR